MVALFAVVVVQETSAIPFRDAGPAMQAGAVTGLLAGSAVLVVTPGVALVSVLARYRGLGPATALGALYAGAGTAAMAGFWAWFARPALGVLFDLALLAASIALIVIFGRRGDLSKLGLPLPLALALAVSVLYTGIAFLRGGLPSVSWITVAHEYWGEVDSDLPALLARKLAAHAPLSGPLWSTWLSSDRPPLQTGFVMLQWPMWGAAARGACYQFLGTVLQSAWLPALWVLFRVRGVPAGRTCAAVLAAAATGVMFFNTVYVWPKMLAGALALAALAILLSRDPGDRWRGAGGLTVVLAVLSMLAHGGTAFALLAFVPFLIPLRRKVTAAGLAGCAAAAAALYLPWVIYQRFVAPPGDRVVKWILAGVIAVDRRGAAQTIVDQYRSLSPAQLLGNKWDNVMTLVANPMVWHRQVADAGWAGGFFGYARIAGINDLVPAAGPLLLGAVALVLPSARRRLTATGPLAAFTVLAVAAWVLLLWGGQSAVGQVTTQVHTGPYAAVVLFVGLCALAVTALPPVLSGAVLAGSAAWFAVEWFPGLTFRPTDQKMYAHVPVSWSTAAVCGCALVVIIVIAVATTARGQTTAVKLKVSVSVLMSRLAQFPPAPG
jgi:hypothetical protein